MAPGPAWGLTLQPEDAEMVEDRQPARSYDVASRGDSRDDIPQRVELGTPFTPPEPS